MKRAALHVTRAVLIPTALLSVAACLAIEDALAPPEKRLYGTRPSVRAMVRFHLRRRADSRHPTASPA